MEAKNNTEIKRGRGRPKKIKEEPEHIPILLMILMIIGGTCTMFSFFVILQEFLDKPLLSLLISACIFKYLVEDFNTLCGVINYFIS